MADPALFAALVTTQLLPRGDVRQRQYRCGGIDGRGTSDPTAALEIDLTTGAWTDHRTGCRGGSYTALIEYWLESRSHTVTPEQAAAITGLIDKNRSWQLKSFQAAVLTVTGKPCPEVQYYKPPKPEPEPKPQPKPQVSRPDELTIIGHPTEAQEREYDRMAAALDELWTRLVQINLDFHDNYRGDGIGWLSTPELKKHLKPMREEWYDLRYIPADTAQAVANGVVEAFVGYNKSQGMLDPLKRRTTGFHVRKLPTRRPDSPRGLHPTDAGKLPEFVPEVVFEPATKGYKKMRHAAATLLLPKIDEPLLVTSDPPEVLDLLISSLYDGFIRVRGANIWRKERGMWNVKVLLDRRREGLLRHRKRKVEQAEAALD
jgi:hypothetical protein